MRIGLLSRLRRRSTGGDGQVQISEQDGVRYLHLGTDTVQSAMRLSDPHELVLSYTRSMLAFLLFAPDPYRIVNIGLGGGSLAKWIHRHLTHAQQLVLELNPRVIACARQYFHLPEDDPRLRVLEADGAAWAAQHPDCCDLVLVDGYDGRSHAAELATPEFYASTARCLSVDGILVVNLWAATGATTKPRSASRPPSRAASAASGGAARQRRGAGLRAARHALGRVARRGLRPPARYGIEL
jgi:spermidine synthase